MSGPFKGGPGFLGYPNPPIAFAKGHSPGCFNGREWVRCVPGCEAQRTWSSQMDQAYREHDDEWERMRGERPNRGSEPNSEEKGGT
jgi:hypothetical protein